MKRIDDDIKEGKLKNIYLLYGEERYLVRQYKHKLIRAFTQDGDTMNFSTFEGKDTDPKQIIDLAETMPFFADWRTILIEDTGWAKKTPDEIGDYLKAIPETTAFIFVEGEADKRSKLYKAAEKYGAAVNFTKLNEQMLARWVAGRIRREGKQMTQAAFEQLILRTGNDMETIDRELEKLLCYTLDKNVIDVPQVEEIVTDHSQRRIFDLVDSICFHRTRQAMDQYYDLVAQKEPPLLILNLVTRQFHNLMLTKAMMNQSKNQKEIAEALNCQDWLVRKYQSQCRSYQLDRLKKAASDGIAYETAVKTGQMADTLAVELFIVENSKDSNKKTIG